MTTSISASWPGIMGALTDRDIGSEYMPSEEMIITSFVNVGIPIDVIPVSALLQPCCSIFDICSHPALRGASEGHAHLLLHFLAAPDWCFKYWIDHRHRLVWDQEGDICVRLRDLDAHHVWTDTDVEQLIGSFGKRVWYEMCRSDVVALATAARSMTDRQREEFRVPVLESIAHTIRHSAQDLFADGNLTVLHEMIVTARTAGLLNVTDIRGHLDSACLAFVLLSCGRYATNLLVASPCESSLELLVWLPSYICTQPWRETWCDAVYGSMEPARIVTTYLDTCAFRCQHVRGFAETWLLCIDAAFYKLWYMLNRMLHSRLV